MENQIKALCTTDEIGPGGGKEVQINTANGPRYIAVFQCRGAIVAYLNSCPHQGRSLAFAPDEFLFGEDGRLVCPHHGACFELASGECMDGPCKGASLTPVEIVVDNGVVCLKQ